MNPFSSHRSLGSLSLALAATTAIFVSGCGGGGNDDAVSPPQGGTISGTAVKGPVAGASISAHSIVNGAMGPAIATAMTDAHGAFSIAVGDHAGPVMLRMTGGTYIDEATGASMGMASGDAMTAALAHMSAGSAVAGVHVTPLTSLAQARAHCMAGGLTSETIAAANTAIGDYFMVHDILHTAPMNPLVPGSSATASQDMIHHGMALAAMSQYANGMGMHASSPVVTSMMSDVCDGVLDGQKQGAPVPMGGHMMGGGMMHPDAGTHGVADAMHDFVVSTHNVSGATLTHMAQLMQKLGASDGHIHH